MQDLAQASGRLEASCRRNSIKALIRPSLFLSEVIEPPIPGDFRGPRASRAPLRRFIATIVKLGCMEFIPSGVTRIYGKLRDLPDSYAWHELFQLDACGNADWQDAGTVQEQLKMGLRTRGRRAPGAAVGERDIVQQDIFLA